jgi:DNA integrity scanning protein DisA with diadenylate cyclase activity
VDVDIIAYVSEIHDGNLKMGVEFTSETLASLSNPDGATTRT